MWKGDLPADVSKVLVPFNDLGLMSSKMRAHEANGGGMEKKPNGNTSFVTCFTRHTSFH